jgi:myosin heavy subunit
VASVVVQTAARQFLAKVETRKMREENEKELIHDLDRRNAAHRRQMTVRSRKAKLSDMARSKDVEHKMYDVAAMCIQAAFRGWNVRDSLTVDHYCATSIQTVFRGFTSRLRYNSQLYSILLIQAEIRGHSVRKRLQESARGFWDEDTPDVAALIIQTRWRGYACEMTFLRIYEDIVFVQKVARGWITRKLLRDWFKANNVRVSSRLMGEDESSAKGSREIVSPGRSNWHDNEARKDSVAKAKEVKQNRKVSDETLVREERHKANTLQDGGIVSRATRAELERRRKEKERAVETQKEGAGEDQNAGPVEINRQGYVRRMAAFAAKQQEERRKLVIRSSHLEEAAFAAKQQEERRKLVIRSSHLEEEPLKKETAAQAAREEEEFRTKEMAAKAARDEEVLRQREIAAQAFLEEEERRKKEMAAQALREEEEHRKNEMIAQALREEEEYRKEMIDQALSEEEEHRKNEMIAQALREEEEYRKEMIDQASREEEEHRKNEMIAQALREEEEYRKKMIDQALHEEEERRQSENAAQAAREEEERRNREVAAQTGREEERRSNEKPLVPLFRPDEASALEIIDSDKPPAPLPRPYGVSSLKSTSNQGRYEDAVPTPQIAEDTMKVDPNDGAAIVTMKLQNISPSSDEEAKKASTFKVQRSEMEQRRIDKIHETFHRVGLMTRQKGINEHGGNTVAGTLGDPVEKPDGDETAGVFEPSASDLIQAWRSRDQTQPKMNGKLF